MEPQVGQEYEVEIERLAYGGAGVGRIDGFVLFIAGALPSERVRARLDTLKKSYGEATVTALLRPSAERVVAPCAHFGPCGGCQWMNLAYPAQLAAKEGQVQESLRRIGGLTGYQLHPISPSPRTLAYRNRMEFAFAPAERGLIAGLHAADDPSRIVEILNCRIQDDRANELLAGILRLCRELGLEATVDRSVWIGRVNQESGAGAARLKRLGIRRGADRRFLVSFWTEEGAFPTGPLLGRGIMESFTWVSGVVRIALTQGSHGADAHLARPTLLAGSDRIVETIAGLSLTITPGAFLQVNPEQAERLYSKVVAFASPGAGERVLDLYCGVGAIALLLGRSGLEVVGVEGSAESVRCAEENARANGVETCRFIAGDVRRELAGMVAEGAAPDLIVVNPPRAGLGREVAGSVARLGPSRIIYVSCDPTTLARDLARLTAFGYRLTDVAPFDMFPHTYHIETVARLERTSPR